MIKVKEILILNEIFYILDGIRKRGLSWRCTILSCIGKNFLNTEKTIIYEEKMHVYGKIDVNSILLKNKQIETA